MSFSAGEIVRGNDPVSHTHEVGVVITSLPDLGDDVAEVRIQRGNREGTVTTLHDCVIAVCPGHEIDGQTYWCEYDECSTW